MSPAPRRSAPAPDLALVRAIIAGSREHFDQLYEEYLPRVHGLALRRLGDPALAEDVTREVFVEVVEALPRWRGESSLVEWIYRLTRRRIVRRLRLGSPGGEAVDHRPRAARAPRAPRSPRAL